MTDLFTDATEAEKDEFKQEMDERQRRISDAEKHRVEYENKAWYQMRGAFYTKEIRRVRYAVGRMAVAGSETKPRVFFMPESDQMIKLNEKPDSSAGELYKLYPWEPDSDAEDEDGEEEEEEGDYSDEAMLCRLQTAIDAHSKVAAVHLMQRCDDGFTWVFL